MNKLIKLPEEHYIIVDDSEMKEGDLFLHTSHGISGIYQINTIDEKSITTTTGERCWIYYSKKITHSTQPLNESTQLNTEFYWNNISKLPLLETEELVYEYSVEKLAALSALDEEYSLDAHYRGYKLGFKKHQKLVKDKLFTIEDIKTFYKHIKTHTFDEAISLILPKTEWNVQFIDGKLKLNE